MVSRNSSATFSQKFHSFPYLLGCGDLGLHLSAPFDWKLPEDCVWLSLYPKDPAQNLTCFGEQWSVVGERYPVSPLPPQTLPQSGHGSLDHCVLLLTGMLCDLGPLGNLSVPQFFTICKVKSYFHGML